MGGSSSTYISKSGTCSNVMDQVSAATCTGTWDAASSVCTIYNPSIGSIFCENRYGTWTPKGAAPAPTTTTLPPFIFTPPPTPAPTTAPPPKNSPDCKCPPGRASSGCSAEGFCNGCYLPTPSGGVVCFGSAPASMCQNPGMKWCGY
ncbi:hypothetical protein SDRG_01012 [Saprolegnia diclina VS20]|uniref:Uncharacterized protein n=1 Tax=Saprolegnia diclina (strain VS20) TaxID=1156394 RepID=T0SA37_SAPDV|nr:hypothetical protein SDRG_01012 [Saprolegnia diclina VS20]EQC42173.1 hypothetical protein SDRG_01012 [Saprolegnia diclina VS20]|eukprot:XP_008604742.1 hypothetical protein SDRG_01012 [Saprolegnia diclina VS20]